MLINDQSCLTELTELRQTHQHFKIFKPYGFLSQFVPEKRKKKHLLGELFNFPDKTMAIGPRLRRFIVGISSVGIFFAKEGNIITTTFQVDINPCLEPSEC